MGDTSDRSERTGGQQSPGFRIIPELSVRRGREAIDFYKAALGAVEVYRVGGTPENDPVVIQFQVGEASFWVSDESPEDLNFSPETLGGGTIRLLLVCDDPESLMRQAVAAGAKEITPVGEDYGWLLGRMEDPFGHHWEIGRPLGPWPPE